MQSDQPETAPAYLQSILQDGARTFRYRSGVRALLGTAACDTGVVRSVLHAPPVGFHYLEPALADEPYPLHTAPHDTEVLDSQVPASDKAASADRQHPASRSAAVPSDARRTASVDHYPPSEEQLPEVLPSPFVAPQAAVQPYVHLQGERERHTPPVPDGVARAGSVTSGDQLPQSIIPPVAVPQSVSQSQRGLPGETSQTPAAPGSRARAGSSPLISDITIPGAVRGVPARTTADAPESLRKPDGNAVHIPKTMPQSNLGPALTGPAKSAASYRTADSMPARVPVMSSRSVNGPQADQPVLNDPGPVSRAETRHVYRTKPSDLTEVKQLQQTVRELSAQLKARQATESLAPTQSGSRRSRRAVVFKRAGLPGGLSRAFWERRYLGRFRLRTVR